MIPPPRPGGLSPVDSPSWGGAGRRAVLRDDKLRPSFRSKRWDQPPGPGSLAGRRRCPGSGCQLDLRPGGPGLLLWLASDASPGRCDADPRLPGSLAGIPQPVPASARAGAPAGSTCRSNPPGLTTTTLLHRRNPSPRHILVRSPTRPTQNKQHPGDNPQGPK